MLWQCSSSYSTSRSCLCIRGRSFTATRLSKARWTSESNQLPLTAPAAPRLLLLTLLLSAVLWVFTTTGGRQIFVKEVLGGAYDSQAEHFLRGDVDVDVDAIGHEAMIVNGKVRMYFGPFPALVRIPLDRKSTRLNSSHVT